MGIMDMFNNVANKLSGAPAATPPNDMSGTNPTIPGNDTARPNGNGPAAFPDASGNAGDKSPLAGFEDLWQAADTDAKAPGSLVPKMNVDHAALMKAAQQVDFAKVISPEVLQKATSGDTAAFAQAMNSVAQASFAQSAAATANIVEQALQRQAKTFSEEVMPDILRRERINNTISQENPLFDSPAVSPMFNMVKERLAQKFPAASSQEIAAKAKEYMTGFASEFAKTQGKTLTDTPKDSAPGTSGGETDWGMFFGVSN